MSGSKQKKQHTPELTSWHFILKNTQLNGKKCYLKEVPEVSLPTSPHLIKPS